MRNEKQWKERISEALTTFGYEGEVSIEVNPENDELLIYHPGFGCPFAGIFSKDGTYLNVLTIEQYEKVPGEDFERMHCEAIVFDASNFNPLYYSIYHEPENQKVMMSDFGKYERGDILYQNNCAHGRYIERILDNPIFESEIFDISKILP